MRNLCVILFITIVFLPAAFADFNRTSGLIDIPTSRILPHLGYRIGVDGSIAINSEKSIDDFDENLHAAIGFGNRFEGYLDIYTIGDFTASVGFCHRFYSQGNFAIAWGIHSLSYALDISEVGHGDSTGWDDDLAYETKPGYVKPFEMVSIFLVSTYSPNKVIDFTVGMGRGKYVGYGQISKSFNSDFYRNQGGDWTVGVFFGLELKAMKNCSFLVDFDGRDVNSGLRVRYLPIECELALSKVEQFGLSFSPRISASISYIKIK